MLQYLVQNGFRFTTWILLITVMTTSELIALISVLSLLGQIDITLIFQNSEPKSKLIILAVLIVSAYTSTIIANRALIYLCQNFGAQLTTNVINRIIIKSKNSKILQTSQIQRILVESVLRFCDSMLFSYSNILQKISTLFVIMITSLFVGLTTPIVLIMIIAIFFGVIQIGVSKVIKNSVQRVSEESKHRSNRILEGIIGRNEFRQYGAVDIILENLERHNRVLFSSRAAIAFYTGLLRYLIELLPILAIFSITFLNYSSVELDIKNIGAGAFIFVRAVPLMHSAYGSYSAYIGNKMALNDLRSLENLTH